MSRINFRPLAAALALTLAAGSAGTAIAATGDKPAQSPGAVAHGHHHHKDHGGHHRGHFAGMRDGLWIPGVGPVSRAQVESLKLDDKQQPMFQQAQEAQRDCVKSMRDSAKVQRDMLDAQLKAGKLDPHALAAHEDQARDQSQAAAKQVRQKWLAVWDSLNDAQRKQVTELVQARQAKWDARKAEHAKHREEHRGDRRGDFSRGESGRTGAGQTNTAPATN